MPGAALPTEQEEFKRSASHLAAGPAIVAGSIFLLLFALTQAFGWMHYRSRGTVAIPAQTDVFVNLDDRVALIGYDAPEVVSRGDPLEVTLYWRAQQEMDINFQVFVHLLDASGVPVSQSDKLNPGDFPTRRWPTDKYVRDLHILSIPETLPAGRYVLSTGMWVQDEGWRLPVLNAAGEQTGDSIRLTEITVK
jgi:hypothetical protein